MIDIQNLTVRYGEQSAVEGLSLSVKRGEFALLTGPSGCGKSTLARCLVGLIPHSSSASMSGRVTVDGLATREHTVAELTTHVGLVFQNPASQLFGLTVDEEVAFGPRNLGLPAHEVAERCRWALRATGMEHMAQRRISTLSAGEQQRVAIAAVLAMRPQILVLDEPTSNLDSKGTGAVLETVAQLHREYGLTILLIEHRLSQAEGLADRAVVMNEGRVVLDGTPHDVFNERGLLSRLGIRYPQQRPQGDWAALSAELQTRQNARGPLLALQSVGAGYDSRTVLEDLDLEIYPGEFVALVGENGAGKTTLARLIAGLLKPRSGRVVWEKSAAHLPLGRRVGLLFQNPLDQLFCDSVEQEVSFGPGNFQMPAGDHLEKVLEAAGLDALRSRNPYALSAGQQQRVALASILSLQPALLVLDEPTMGQDWGSLSRMMDFLVELNGGGQSILLITHDYKLVCRYAERVLVLEDGHVSARTIDVGSNVELKEEREKKREVLGT